MTADEASELMRLVRTVVDDVRVLRQLVSGRLKSHLTVEEVADLTGRAPYTVRAWVKRGLIQAVRVDGTGPRGRLLVPREELRKLVTAGRAADTPEVVIG
jgi:excisionase family DNA binding protein